MARVTIEDCLEKEANKFRLVAIASLRTHGLLGGKQPLVPVENDKWPVIALREVAQGDVDVSILKDAEYQSLMEEFRERTQQQDRAISQIGAVDNL